MSWVQRLYETYERNGSCVGEGDNPLLPVGHTTQKRAHLQITLDGKGNFVRASVVSEAIANLLSMS